MNEVRALISNLIEMGVDPLDAAEIVTRAAIHGAASVPKTRSAGAIRQERYRRNTESKREGSSPRHESVTVTVSDAGDTLLPPEGSSPTPPSPKPLSSIPPSPPKGGSSPAEFPNFWDLFPNKVGKRKAEAEFAKAIKRASIGTIMAGLRRYVAKTDDRPWCNPSTWLHQDRWEDRPATVSQNSHSPPPKRTVGQQARDELRRMGISNVTDTETRYRDEGDGSPDIAGSGIARRIAFAAGGR